MQMKAQSKKVISFLPPEATHYRNSIGFLSSTVKLNNNSLIDYSFFQLAMTGISDVSDRSRSILSPIDSPTHHPFLLLGL
jgi:hypothetical protein